ncbi:MAG: hypothetical protein MUF54_16815 [Polyangiaceae bacterium]|jgi:hypothetical protein|nr:hypothetical protein [Polyangiaceae bacterium]
MEILGQHSPKRTIILVGDYGSGKTEIAVNLALHLTAVPAHRPVAIADLDLVNPYFRCREAIEPLENASVRVVVPSGGHRFADLPILLPQVKGLLQGRDGRSVLDVGGDEVGSRVLAGLADAFDAAVHELWFVVNANRPFNDTVEACTGTIRRIEHASRLRVTGLVPNTHLMEETTPQMVLWGVDLAHRLGSSLQLPVAMVAVMESMAEHVNDNAIADPILRMRRLMLPPWLKRNAPRAGPDLFRPRPI